MVASTPDHVAKEYNRTELHQTFILPWVHTRNKKKQSSIMSPMKRTSLCRLRILSLCLLIGTADGFSSLVLKESSLRCPSSLKGIFYNDFEEEPNRPKVDNTDFEIDPDSLGDWRLFRKKLADAASTANAKIGCSTGFSNRPKSVSKPNEEVLQSQNAALYEEYMQGAWAHPIPTAEVGGLVVRLPLEAEIYRNKRHSRIGARLHASLSGEETTEDWFRRAKSLLERELRNIAKLGGDGGFIDANTLSEDSVEVLSLYTDHQNSWQETCLVLEQNEKLGSATTLVLNRPMAFKLTDHIARLCVHGLKGVQDSSRASSQSCASRPNVDLAKFMRAFEQECAVYIGGPDDQEQPAELIHGISTLPGAKEISRGTGIYRGGLQAAIEGVLVGLYKPLDFRFFIGRHSYDESGLDLLVRMGKYQPIACSRPLVLKQCISLPKPLWHEILELSGGEMEKLSALELNKRNEIQYEIFEVDDEDESEDESDEEDSDIATILEFIDDISETVFDELSVEDDDVDEL